MSAGKPLDFSQNSVMAYTNFVYASFVLCVAQIIYGHQSYSLSAFVLLSLLNQALQKVTSHKDGFFTPLITFPTLDSLSLSKGGLNCVQLITC